MRYLHYSSMELSEYPVVLLVGTIRKDDIRKSYIEPYGLNEDSVLVMDLHQSQGKKKTPMQEMRQYVNEMLNPVLINAKTKYVIVTDGDYFKAFTGLAKVEPYLGYVLDSKLGDYKVIYAPNYRQMFTDPVKVKSKIEIAMRALKQHAEDMYSDPGQNIIHFAEYPQTTADIKAWLDKLLAMNCPLSVDIEGFSLKHHSAGIGTITFCWNQNEGIAFPVDYQSIPGATKAPFGIQVQNDEVRALLVDFFLRMKQKIIYHNIAYDAYVLIYQLFMDHILDTEGLLKGMDVMLDNWDCTKLIAYLATNSCAGNKLGLKEQSQEYSGNYALDDDDIKDITRIPLDKLLTYNLVDGLSTWFVHNKRWNQMVQDQQLPVYTDLFQPATKDIIQMQLTGLPVNIKRVKEVKKILEDARQNAENRIHSTKIIQQFTYTLNEEWVNWKNSVLKKKRVTMADATEYFNPSSNPQLQRLLYDILGLPVIAVSKKSKLPATGGEVLKSLINHTDKQEVKDLLTALVDLKGVEKILSSFIPPMEAAAEGPDGWHYLFGNFNLGGTVSGRLSSSNPNLQNLPANSKYAKLIKSCIQAPPGWLFMGLDFASLEDRISALTTKDPNKLKVYTDGFDGHAMRAVAYYPEEMPDIDPTSVESVNSIAEKGHKYADWRQESKVPTFALTYQGTYITLMKNSGFSEEKAKRVEARYHELYEVSGKWIQDKLNQASDDGYVTVAFGLRVRTPLLAQVIRGTSRTPHEADSEGRTAGNALGQSWCLLNSRAASEFMGKVRTSEHRLNIRPCAHIHDAQYYLVRDDMPVVEWTNEHLVEAVKWQDHPDIAHDEVKLGGELSLFYPTWEKEAVIPNGAKEEEIYAAVQKHLSKL